MSKQRHTRSNDHEEEEQASLLAYEPKAVAHDALSWWRRQPRRTKQVFVASAVMLLVLVVILASGPSSSATSSSEDQEDMRLYHPDVVMTTLQGTATKHHYPVSRLAKEQITNYRDGNGVLINLYMIHQGGAMLCDTFGQVAGRRAPDDLYCRLTAKDLHLKDDEAVNTVVHHPWQASDTASNVQALLQENLHFVTWEYGLKAPRPSLRSTDWEDPHVVSVLIMRHPLSRLLVGDRWVRQQYPGIYNPDREASKDDWWKFAHDVNNLVLHVLAGNPCCSGKDTDERFLDYATALASRFTFVLDMACLNEGMVALADLLGVTLPPLEPMFEEEALEIPHDGIYDYLVEGNRLDIEVYEWSKTRALVDCSTVPKTTRRPTQSPSRFPTAKPSTMQPTLSPTMTVTNASASADELAGSDNSTSADSSTNSTDQLALQGNETNTTETGNETVAEVNVTQSDNITTASVESGNITTVDNSTRIENVTDLDDQSEPADSSTSTEAEGNGDDSKTR